MSWIPPKTNWSGAKGEYFNLDPDYKRIKGNIEYLTELGNELYLPFAITSFANPDISDIPTVSFFNNVANNTDVVRDNTMQPTGYVKLRRYEPNGTIWDYKELNNIENNALLMYNLLNIQKGNLKRLAFKLGGGIF